MILCMRMHTKWLTLWKQFETWLLWAITAFFSSHHFLTILGPHKNHHTLGVMHQYSWSTYFQSRPHQEPIECHNFDKVGTRFCSDYNQILLWHMSLGLILKWGGLTSFDKVWTLVISSSQLLTSKIHNNFSLRNKITVNFIVLMICHFLNGIHLHHLIHL